MDDVNSGGKYVLGAVGACVLALGIAGIWNEGLGGGKPAIKVSAADLYAAYLKNAAAADQQYAGRSLLVTGMAGSTQLEGGDYILTLVPGIRAHLGSQTAGANLFEQVTLRCDGVTFANATVDLEGCEISAETPGASTGMAVAEAAAEEVAPGSPCDGIGASYGHAPNREVASAFEAATGHRQGFCMVDENDGNVITRPLQLVDLPSGKALLTEREGEDDCHGCNGGAIGVFYLTERSGKFRVTGKWPKAVEGSGWGKPPSVWYITNKFTSAPAIYAEHRSMGQGYEYQGASITELGPRGPVTSDPIATLSSDEGAVIGGSPCILKGEIANIVRDRSFNVRVTGYSEFTDRYEKRGGKFVDVSGNDWGEVCD